TKDPFDEVDFGQYFQEYRDPGYRSRQEWEDVEKPSFENFLSRPATLTDHLMWQLSSMRLKEEVAEAAELVIGNLNEEGYLTATEDELMGVVAPEQEATRSDTNGKEEAASRLTSSELEGIWEMTGQRQTMISRLLHPMRKPRRLAPSNLLSKPLRNTTRTARQIPNRYTALRTTLCACLLPNPTLL
ncbi:MAG: hypothetical protein DMG67_19070, partial [Acidobacteria bacterium]